MKLHHETVLEGSPTRWAFVLHGVFGSAANWRLFMKNLVKERSDWGFILVDLRGHAGSLGGDAPHDIEAMAADLEETGAGLGLDVRGVIGHSLGGKVALAYAERRRGELDQVWSLDSQPGTRGAEESPTETVLELLEGLPATFSARQDFVEAVVAAGQARPVAAWLAMNLRRAGDDYRLALDLTAVRAILADFWRRDLWSAIERPDDRRKLHVVVGEKSFVWNDEDRARLERAPIDLHLLDAGHWIHVDAGDALRALLCDEL